MVRGSVGASTRTGYASDGGILGFGAIQLFLSIWTTVAARERKPPTLPAQAHGPRFFISFVYDPSLHMGDPLSNRIFFF